MTGRNSSEVDDGVAEALSTTKNAIYTNRYCNNGIGICTQEKVGNSVDQIV